MIAVSTWVWVVVGIVVFPLLGLLAAAALGLAGAPSDALRRLGHTLTLRRTVYRGQELPDEVPEDRSGEEPTRPRGGTGGG